MTHHVTNNFKKVALGLVALFALAFLPSCWFDTNNCYTEAYIVCDNGVEFVQTEYCTPYRDFWGNWYEECVYDGYYQQNCWTDYRCVDAPQCWTDADCKGARACVNNRCETYKFPPNNNGGNGNNGNNGGNNNNTQTCSTDNDCGTNGVCVKYGNYKSCAQSCLNNSHCSNGYVCEFLSNSLSQGACLDRSYPCNKAADCHSGMVCAGGSCKVSCNSSNDCTVGNASFTCVSGGYCNT